ncbi:hypothetical protein SYNPS1DRAFT_30299 [Syncephalis pseudoplumigaleata]|uniref:Uncharacterized protein n=1 Tax=Syncephalis pseudoplumigaleata TaxID=1712513 RepID=A0A4P9YVS7_9FUNG|nr:hypothetical protein SYNPS1DRAFT_30299 [Syncephalis pseudoplumigaleata]|eukprot:RKP23928.1 hypothetical protein SYNPS1DRAFT_30299 [Syncephalis pseudoplumigaleata]
MKQKASRRFLPGRHGHGKGKGKRRDAAAGHDTDAYLDLLGEQLTRLEDSIATMNTQLGPWPSSVDHTTTYAPAGAFDTAAEATKWPTGSERRSRLAAERRRIEASEHATLHTAFIKSLGQDTRNGHLAWGITNRGRALGELYTNRVLAWTELLRVAEQERRTLLERHQREVPMADDVREAAESLVSRVTTGQLPDIIERLQQKTRQYFGQVLAKHSPSSSFAPTTQSSPPTTVALTPNGRNEAGHAAATTSSTILTGRLSNEHHPTNPLLPYWFNGTVD